MGVEGGVKFDGWRGRTWRGWTQSLDLKTLGGGGVWDGRCGTHVVAHFFWWDDNNQASWPPRSPPGALQEHRLPLWCIFHVLRWPPALCTGERRNNPARIPQVLQRRCRHWTWVFSLFLALTLQGQQEQQQQRDGPAPPVDASAEMLRSRR